MERIVIKNFGPIKDVDLEVNDFMIFIGPQASGKSTIAKLIYFFKALKHDFPEYVLNKSFQHDTDLIEDYQRYLTWELRFTMQMVFEENLENYPFISYNYKNGKSITLKRLTTGLYSFILNEKFRDELEKLGSIIGYYRSILPQLNQIPLNNEQRIYKSEFRREIQNYSVTLFEEINNRDLIFIPDGRGNYLDRKDGGNRFESQFYNIIETVQQEQLEQSIENDNKSEIINLANSIIYEILKAKYRFDIKDRDLLELSNDKRIKLFNASSGQKEAVWILEVIHFYLKENNKVFAIIEEPEAHLYPEAQKSITELIVLLVNLLDNQAIITTHSPYILASINNLLYANKVGRTHEKEVAEKIDKNLWLNYKRIGAYFVGGEDNEGRIRPIMDHELEMIESQYIDSASSIINEEFDFMYALED